MTRKWEWSSINRGVLHSIHDFCTDVNRLTFTFTAGGESKSACSCLSRIFEKNNQYCFSLKELEWQCRSLVRQGYRFVSFEDFQNGKLKGSANILLTIDDGNRSSYDAYYHVLKPLGIRPLLAIYPAVVGNKKYALTWEQLRRLKRDGCTIAAHGYYHLHLNKRLYLRDPVSFKREIIKSRKVLEKNWVGR